MLINDLIVIAINRVNYIEWALLNSKFEGGLQNVHGISIRSYIELNT